MNHKFIQEVGLKCKCHTKGMGRTEILFTFVHTYMLKLYLYFHKNFMFKLTFHKIN